MTQFKLDEVASKTNETMAMLLVDASRQVLLH